MPEGWELRINTALDGAGISRSGVLQRSQGLVCRIEHGMTMLQEESRQRENTQRRLDEATKVKEEKKVESRERLVLITDLTTRLEMIGKELDRLQPALGGMEVVRGEAARKGRCVAYIATIRRALTIPSVAIEILGVFKIWPSFLAFVIVTLSNLLICVKQADSLPQSGTLHVVIISLGSYGFAGICTVVSDICEGFPTIKKILRPIFLVFIVSFAVDYANSEAQQTAQSVIFGVVIANITANHLGSDVYTKLWLGISICGCIFVAILYQGSVYSIIIQAIHFQVAVFIAGSFSLLFDTVLYLLSLRSP